MSGSVLALTLPLILRPAATAALIFGQLPPAPAAPAGPDPAPVVRRFVQGGLWTPPGPAFLLLACLVGWLVVWGLAVGFIQGDWRKWLRGVADIRRHFERLGEGLEILRRNKRPLWVLLASAVASWTGWALGVWDDQTALAELEQLLAVRENSVISFAAAHALPVAIAPLRDLLGLGDLLPLVICACVVLFARTARLSQHLRNEMRAMETARHKRRLGTVWVGLILLVGHRAITFVAFRGSAPLADCIVIDSLIVPLLVLAADGVFLSWVLVELGRGVRHHFDWDSSDTAAFARGFTPAMFTCAVTNPGRYLVLAGAMLEQQLSGGVTWRASRWAPILWAAAVVQVVGLAWFALPGVLVACRRGGLKQKLVAYLQLLRRAGGEVVGLTVLSVALSLAVTLPFFWLFGSMQPETWSLVGAASYGHYATLLVGLVLLVGVTQLAVQELGVEDDTGPTAVVLEPALAAAGSS